MNGDSIKERVIKKLNTEFGNDVKNLSKCLMLSNKFSKEKENIEKEIKKAYDNVSTADAVHEIGGMSHIFDEITERFNNLCTVVREKENSSSKSSSDLQIKIKKIQQLEQGISYIRCVRSIQDISSNMEMYLASRSEAEAIAEFGVLCQMCARLDSSKCTHLTTYLNDTLHHWHNVLKDKLSVQLDEVLKIAGWPVTSSITLTTPSADCIARLQLVIKHILEIQLPPELTTPSVTSSLLGNFPPLSLPIIFMLKPLRKRFIYHFCGNKKTNQPERPEWFMTQVLTWIRDNEHFMAQWVQPVFNQSRSTKMSAQLELTQGLVELVVDKLHSDMPLFMTKDETFIHTVGETLGFDKELKEITGYPESLPSAITVLTQAHVFVKWIHMERKYARDKMDTILSSESAWSELSGSDDLHITEAAEAFLNLLSTMTERYSVLPQPGHRLQFVELQLELIDDLRVRLLQLLHSERQDPLDSRLPAILNTASFIYTALAEWGTKPHYLMLQHYKSQLESVGTELSAMETASLRQGTVFDHALTLLQHLVQELVDILCDAVMLEVKARSRPYRRDKWFAMTCENSLTPSASPMFQVLGAKLHSLQSLLSSSLFAITWQSVANQLCTFLLEELILQNRFNDGGAKQLERDLTRSLIPLFHQYTNRPEAYFMPLMEACILLNVHPLPADWTRGKYNNLPSEIHHLSQDLIHDVIQKRVDIIPDLI